MNSKTLLNVITRYKSAQDNNPSELDKLLQLGGINRKTFLEEVQKRVDQKEHLASTANSFFLSRDAEDLMSRGYVEDFGEEVLNKMDQGQVENVRRALKAAKSPELERFMNDKFKEIIEPYFPKKELRRSPLREVIYGGEYKGQQYPGFYKTMQDWIFKKYNYLFSKDPLVLYEMVDDLLSWMETVIDEKRDIRALSRQAENALARSRYKRDEQKITYWEEKKDADGEKRKIEKKEYIKPWQTYFEGETVAGSGLEKNEKILEILREYKGTKIPIQWVGEVPWSRDTKKPYLEFTFDLPESVEDDDEQHLEDIVFRTLVPPGMNISDDAWKNMKSDPSKRNTVYIADVKPNGAVLSFDKQRRDMLDHGYLELVKQQGLDADEFQKFIDDLFSGFRKNLSRSRELEKKYIENLYHFVGNGGSPTDEKASYLGTLQDFAGERQQKEDQEEGAEEKTIEGIKQEYRRREEQKAQADVAARASLDFDLLYDLLADIAPDETERLSDLIASEFPNRPMGKKLSDVLKTKPVVQLLMDIILDPSVPAKNLGHNLDPWRHIFIEKFISMASSRAEVGYADIKGWLQEVGAPLDESSLRKSLEIKTYGGSLNDLMDQVRKKVKSLIKDELLDHVVEKVQTFKILLANAVKKGLHNKFNVGDIKMFPDKYDSEYKSFLEAEREALQEHESRLEEISTQIAEKMSDSKNLKNLFEQFTEYDNALRATTDKAKKNQYSAKKKEIRQQIAPLLQKAGKEKGQLRDIVFPVISQWEKDINNLRSQQSEIYRDARNEAISKMPPEDQEELKKNPFPDVVFPGGYTYFDFLRAEENFQSIGKSEKMGEKEIALQQKIKSDYNKISDSVLKSEAIAGKDKDKYNDWRRVSVIMPLLKGIYAGKKGKRQKKASTSFYAYVVKMASYRLKKNQAA